MPPLASFNVTQNTPEADKLERRLHEQLKEIWDPTADATVAKYLTAMLAKGLVRKKIHMQLKTILQEDVTVQLLDWLYKHLRLHGHEYQSRGAPASSKPISKTPASASKMPQAAEDELRLEDLEAQQLEGSDLDDDIGDAEAERSDHGGANAAGVAVGHPEARSRDHVPEPHQRSRSVTEPTRRPAQGSQPDAAESGGAHALGTSTRSERRNREPIPTPNFSEPVRAGTSRSGGGSDGAVPQPTAARSNGGAEGVRKADMASAERQQAGSSTERPRLKSSVVLDWQSWQKQKQPDDEQQGGRSTWGPVKHERAPVEHRTLPDRTVPDRANQPQQLPDADHDRDRDRGGGMARRRQPHEADADRPEARHRDQDGDASARRGHDREGDAAGRRGDRGRDVPARRSRSRSRSRSPRGRRSGRAPLIATANLLRTALRGVDGLPAGGTVPAARGVASQREGAQREGAQREGAQREGAQREGAQREGAQEEGAGANGAKPSVFARLGLGSAGAADEGPARASRTQRVAGPDRGTDTAALGRKRGLDGTDGGDTDGAVLGSPPKAARSAPGQRPTPVSLVSPSQARAQLPSTSAARAGPATGRQCLGTPPAPTAAGGAKAGVQQPQQPPARQQRTTPETTAAPSGVGGGEGAAASNAKADSAAATAMVAAAAESTVDPKAAELEALRQQMAAMQEQIARMEASKSQPQPPAEPPKKPISMRLQGHPMATMPAPVSGRMGAGGMGVGDGGPGMGAIMPTSMSGVVIEGGRGSPPRRPASQQAEVAQKAEQQRMAAAQLDAEMRSVVVENVHFMANEEVLAAHFSVVGPVKNVVLLRNDFTRRPTGVAVVEMANERATQAAAALSGSFLMDCPIVVTLKAALLLQGMGISMGAPPMGAGRQARGPTVAAGPAGVGMLQGGRLNAAAPPFVPATAASGPNRPPMGAAGGVERPQAAATGLVGMPPLIAPGALAGFPGMPPVPIGGAGRPPWPRPVAGGRGVPTFRPNVWVRDNAVPGKAVGSITDLG